MRYGRFILLSLLLIALQAVLLNMLDLSQLITIMIMPVIILSLPLSMGTMISVVIAFIAGILLDFFSSGMIGLTSCALMPVALARKTVISLVCGEETFSRSENISIKRHGIMPVGTTVLLCSLLFFIIYVIIDGAGTRPFWFNFSRILLSSIFSTLTGLLCIDTLVDKD